LYPPPIGYLRSLLVYALLLSIKAISRVFYRHDFRFVGEVPDHPWEDLRVVAFLNHTSLFEPIFVGGVPNSFVWRLARHGVVPAAEKTIRRPLVGALFRFVARHVVSITRERDHTWSAVLQRIDPGSMVIILPEGRMKRANGLDLNGQPMTVRGGIADILEAIPEGRMLIAYSGGLHHVQIPGHLPKAFRKVSMRLEVVRIEDYREELQSRRDSLDFKKRVREDLERRRDLHCIPQELAANGRAVLSGTPGQM
jgi:hypothetical protein